MITKFDDTEDRTVKIGDAPNIMEEMIGDKGKKAIGPIRNSIIENSKGTITLLTKNILTRSEGVEKDRTWEVHRVMIRPM